MFWRKRRANVSPTMVDASVSTLVTSKCDVGTNTEDMDVEGDMNSNQEPPPVEYAEGCEPLVQFSPPEWPQSYGNYIPQENENWGQMSTNGAPAPEMNAQQAPPPAEYAEGCDQLPYLSQPQWPQPYEYYMPHQYEWGQWYSYGAPEYAEWCGTYAYNSPPAYPPEWSQVTPM